MDDEIKFYRFDLEAETNALTLSNAVDLQIYIAVECKNGRCDQRKLIHPSSFPVSPDDFHNLGISKIVGRMRCSQCKRKSPRISYFKEYDPLYTGKLPFGKELVPLHWLSKDESFCGDRYNYRRTEDARWLRPDTYDDPDDRGSPPDPNWREDESIRNSYNWVEELHAGKIDDMGDDYDSGVVK